MNELAIFIDNRKPSIITFFSRLVYKKLNAAPLLTYKRSYWYGERWEVMCKSGAIAVVFGWCGQVTPAYPHDGGHPSAICHECGRTIGDFYEDWIYRAEYEDGCKVMLYENGGTSSEGVDNRSGFSGTHAPHSAFSSPDEIPVYEFLHPSLRFDSELCLSFRKRVYER
jgi:hypothetical protein